MLYHYFYHLLLCRPPPCPPLFPYTTLFRSVAGPGGAKGFAARRAFRASADLQRHPTCGARLVRAHEHDGPLRRGLEGRSEIDRKSTRLNSSHRCISYAVFCLKKKNK